MSHQRKTNGRNADEHGGAWERSPGPEGHPAALSPEEETALEAALRRSQERFSKVFHSHPDTMLILSADTGEILEANAGLLT